MNAYVLLMSGLMAGIQSFIPATGNTSIAPYIQTAYAAIAAAGAKNSILPVTAYNVWVTAYSSAPEETDDTPFITALGTETRDGILAANFLPFGTKVQIPEFFGDKIFVVEDRMHPRKSNFVDIWMPTKKAALRFGIASTTIVIAEEPENEVSLAATPTSRQP